MPSFIKKKYRTIMNKKEMNSLVETLADKVAERVINHLKGDQKSLVPEMVDSNEAARILGVSRQYLLQIKDKFSFVKVGESKQSRIFFKKDDLLKEFTERGVCRT